MKSKKNVRKYRKKYRKKGTRNYGKKYTRKSTLKLKQIKQQRGGDTDNIIKICAIFSNPRIPTGLKYAHGIHELKTPPREIKNFCLKYKKTETCRTNDG